MPNTVIGKSDPRLKGALELREGETRGMKFFECKYNIVRDISLNIYAKNSE